MTKIRRENQANDSCNFSVRMKKDLKRKIEIIANHYSRKPNYWFNQVMEKEVNKKRYSKILTESNVEIN